MVQENNIYRFFFTTRTLLSGHPAFKLSDLLLRVHSPPPKPLPHFHNIAVSKCVSITVRCRHDLPSTPIRWRLTLLVLDGQICIILEQDLRNPNVTDRRDHARTQVLKSLHPPLECSNQRRGEEQFHNIQTNIQMFLF